MQPTGTLTFLFTDIEGSTQRWERDQGAMSTELAEHDQLLRAVIEQRGGQVFKTVGDAFCAAFPLATAAVDAALQVQSALVVSLPEMRVRIALHSGQAEARDGDYFGPALNRVARLLAVGHGGQVLVSEATAGLVRDAMPPASALLDLSEHRLKDLARPERVFQLSGADLPADFPPLASIEGRPNNLPIAVNAFFGREPETAAVRQLLVDPAVRLVTLTGPGGTGKTRLALQLAGEVLDEFPDGAFFVDLAPLADADLVPAAIAQTLGVREVPGQAPIDTLRVWLQPRRMLLLLDNLEQVAPAAESIATLVTTCPRITLLATSRAPLHVRGEREYPLSPLPVPPPATTLDALSRYASVSLFVERATALRPDFAVTADTAPIITAICAKLDGLPLAIELAAARIKTLPPAALLTRLDARLRLLTGGARDLPERQRTMQAAIDWSHDLLDDDEKDLFRRLSVFRGGCTLDAAEGVCADPGDRLDVLDELTSLVDKSLVRQTETDGTPRYDMLETIREYAAAQLQLLGEGDVRRERHAEWFAEQADRGEDAAYGSGDERMLIQMANDYANLLTALTWSLDLPDRLPYAFRLIGGLWRLWNYYGGLAEGSRLCLLTIERANSAGIEVPARAAYGIAATVMRHDRSAGRQHMQRALEDFRDADDTRGIAWALNDLGIMETYDGQIPRSIDLIAESLQLKLALGNQWDIAVGQHNLGEMLLLSGELARAEALEEAALATVERLGNTGLGLRGDVQKNLGLAALIRGDVARAVAYFAKAIHSANEAGVRPYMAKALLGLGHCAAHSQDHRRAARLFAAYETMLGDAGYEAEPIDELPRPVKVVAAQSGLTETEWQLAWSEGVTMSQDEALAYALATEAAP